MFRQEDNNPEPLDLSGNKTGEISVGERKHGETALDYCCEVIPHTSTQSLESPMYLANNIKESPTLSKIVCKPTHFKLQKKHWSGHALNYGKRHNVFTGNYHGEIPSTQLQNKCNSEGQFEEGYTLNKKDSVMMSGGTVFVRPHVKALVQTVTKINQFELIHMNNDDMKFPKVSGKVNQRDSRRLKRSKTASKPRGSCEVFHKTLDISCNVQNTCVLNYSSAPQTMAPADSSSDVVTSDDVIKPLLSEGNSRVCFSDNSSIPLNLSVNKKRKFDHDRNCNLEYSPVDLTTTKVVNKC